jgi:acyl-CoA synthetase (AMP-forming)/AMP-acid ligase II
MLGLMQEHKLLVSSLIEHAVASHPEAEIVSRSVEGPIHRCTYRDIHRRAKQLANALTGLGVQRGERVATLAWNGYRHMELYFGVSGMGAVLHTVNPRLFPEQLEYIINHAEDTILCFDLSFVGLVEALLPRLNTVRAFVLMTDREHMPSSSIPGLLCYEELLAAQCDSYSWPDLDENTATSLCYTSGTTGMPKGVLYSHRSTVLHAFGACTVDSLAVSRNETALLVVPMFHVNAWSMPYVGAMSGAKLVLPGPALDGASVYQLLRDEKVTLALGVPTVWMMCLQYVSAAKLKPIDELSLRRVLIGGSAVPRTMIEAFERELGAFVVQIWGMTEISPIGTACNLLPQHQALPREQRRHFQAKQGRAVFGVSLKITDDEGRRLEHDGQAAGHLKVRGPWVAKAYYRDEGGPILDDEGYFDTGDVATIDPDGYMQITDRAKDVIKSGGEWISSIDLENAAVGHPAIAEAAVIGIAHPKWQERPLMLVVVKPGETLERDAVLRFLETRVAKWWLPDDVVFVTGLPHTATGKLLKTALRDQFRDYHFSHA